jgi:hypothetical protein
MTRLEMVTEAHRLLIAALSAGPHGEGSTNVTRAIVEAARASAIVLDQMELATRVAPVTNGWQ